MGLWIILALAGLLAVASWSPGRTSAAPSPAALRILDERLARGELSTADHAERRTLMVADLGTKHRRWRVGMLALGGVALGLLLVSAVSGLGSGWTSVGSMGGHMGWGTTTAANTAAFPDGQEVGVDAGDLWFAPEQIEVTAGTEVNLRLTNTGRAFHDLTVPAAGLVIEAGAGDAAVGGLRLDEPGSYEFYCSVPGHAAAGMRGTIDVTG